MFASGTLWERIRTTTDRALRQGVLQPIPTEFEMIEEAGVRFLVRVVANLARKKRATEPTGSRQPAVDLLGSCDPALWVTDVSASHVCLLNKFNVLEQHVLIVTRHFEPQETALNLADFTAFWTCMAEYDALGFYNSGAVAGASQPRKHLQMVPLPMAASGPRVPIEPLVDAAEFQGPLGQIPELPFAHVVARLDANLVQSQQPAVAAQQSLPLYRAMLQAMGVGPDPHGDGQLPLPYNLLVTRQWMLLVPRSRESFQNISLNALAFAGSLLVGDQQQLEVLKQAGPMAALKHVTVEASSLGERRT